MKVSSSMIRTSVAISAAISRPAVSVNVRVSAMSMLRMNATSSSEKPSSDSSRNACRGSGVMFDSLPLRRQRQRRHVRVVVERNRVPDLGEQLEQPGARAMPFVQQRTILQQSIPAWRPHRHRPRPGFRSAHGHSAATAADVQQRAVIGTSPFNPYLGPYPWPYLRVSAGRT